MRRDGMRSHFLSGNKRIGGRFIMCVCVCREIYVLGFCIGVFFGGLSLARFWGVGSGFV